jgi:hypothetical protein
MNPVAKKAMQKMNAMDEARSSVQKEKDRSESMNY